MMVTVVSWLFRQAPGGLGLAGRRAALDLFPRQRAPGAASDESDEPEPTRPADGAPEESLSEPTSARRTRGRMTDRQRQAREY